MLKKNSRDRSSTLLPRGLVIEQLEAEQCQKVRHLLMASSATSLFGNIEKRKDFEGRSKQVIWYLHNLRKNLENVLCEKKMCSISS